MKTRKLRELEVSAIGYGCMGLSHGYGAVPEHDEAIRLIRKAYETGCTFFDTAESYGAGTNEVLVGEAVKPFRQNIILATKLHLDGEYTEEQVDNLLQSHLNASMERLDTDYVDLYYLHRMPKFYPIEYIAKAMGKLIEKGKIKGWGLSQCSEEELRRANAVTPVTAVQCEYSIMERMFEKRVIPTCEELGVGFVSFSPLASGFLSGKYTADTVYKGDDVRRVITRFSKENVEHNQPLLVLLNQYAQEKKATPAQISLAWMLHKKEFIVPIPGMRKDSRIIENLGAAEIELSDSEFQKIEAELEKITIYGNRTDEDIAKLKDMD